MVVFVGHVLDFAMPCFVAGADWNCFCPGDIVAAMEEVKVLLGDAGDAAVAPALSVGMVLTVA